ncbi:hypothetical protein [Nocardia sp. NBC_01327]|uniref:hypothetical protein n=1 Tax=Nocardia sp. NBC_01327 TaxID=2903593 RepID=UPI002E1298D8|nr:hypothetical protein OG326_42615 [Nocardia sp. NBC_01327]
MDALLLLNAMQRRWHVTRVGKLFFATPVVTAVMAWLLVDQPLRPLTFAGLTIGVVLASQRPVVRHEQPLLATAAH